MACAILCIVSFKYIKILYINYYKFFDNKNHFNDDNNTEAVNVNVCVCVLFNIKLSLSLSLHSVFQ